MIPEMRAYFDVADALAVDGGYYCKTPDNRPLIGPLPVEGAYIAAALPDYAKAFLFSRFDGLSDADRLDMRDATRGQL